MPSNRLLHISASIAIVAAVALGAGAWFYHQQSAELKKQAVELRETKQALDTSMQQAREQAQQLNDAVKNSEQYSQEQKAKLRRIGVLTNGLNAANAVKVAMAESYMTNMKWPVSNKQAGVPEPEGFKAEGIASIYVQPNGKIKLNLVNPEGQPEQLWLTGSINDAMLVSWKCTTEDIVDIAQLVPACSYSGK